MVMRRAWPAASAVLACLAIPAAAQTPLFGADSRNDATESLAGAFSCPVDKLVDLYSSLAPDELPARLAVETEVLLICAERQEKLRSILTVELELRELMDIPDPGPGAGRISVAGHAGPAAVQPAAAPAACPPVDGPPADGREIVQAPPLPEPAPAAQTPPVPTEAQPPGDGRDGVLMSLVATALTRLSDSAAAGERQQQSCGGWSWLWTVRTAQGQQLARLIDADGSAVEVREQDLLDGGLSVARIGPDGVSVQDARGAVWPLPRAVDAPEGEVMAGPGGEREAEAEDSTVAAMGMVPTDAAERLEQQ